MSSQTHTPGPWAVIKDDHDITVDGQGWFEDQHVNGWVIVGNPDSAEMAIAVIDTGYRNSWDDAKRDGNAALIAAAPQMHADLIKAEAMFRHYGDLHAAKPDAEKAKRNYDMADKLAATLATAVSA